MGAISRSRTHTDEPSGMPMLWLSAVALLSFQAPLRSTPRHAVARPYRNHAFCIEAPADDAAADENGSGDAPPSPEPPPSAASAAAARSAAASKFDVRESTKAQRQDGAGFNQFDPVLTFSRFISRRFGLAGGLIFVALLAATEGNEILKSVLETGPKEGSGQTITTPSGLQYVDVLVSSSGDTPKPGAVIGFNAKVSIGGSTLFDSTAGPNAKPIAFKYGQRPFQNVVCEGVEEGIKSMRAGGKRTLLVPKALAPKGVDVPDGVKLQYEIELLEVLPGYF